MEQEEIPDEPSVVVVNHNVLFFLQTFKSARCVSIKKKNFFEMKRKILNFCFFKKKSVPFSLI